MGHVYTLEIGGIERKFVDLNYETKLINKSPTKVSAKIEYADDINYFDLVVIKSDGVIEWKGFLEDRDIDWTSGGRYINIGGRDTSVIMWKKWCENFINMHPDTGGFFGSVSAMELIKFLLRCPKSDAVSLYPNNKEGWGIDAGRITNCSAYRTSVGDPTWVKLRRQGYGWRNVGSPFNSEILAVNAVVSNEWTPHGGSPYLKVEDDGNYISSGVVGQTAIFSFPNMNTLSASATGINKAYVTVSWRPDQTWWFWIQAETDVYIYDGTDWFKIGNFGGRNSPWDANPWRRYTWDVSNILDTIAKVDAAQIKFVCQSSALSTNITYAFLSVSYQTSGVQEEYDYFDIAFLEEEIMGIYFESRMDDDSYPRNYAIYNVIQDIQDYTTYAETDPNSKITKTATHIDFDAYMNVDGYVYKDFTVGYFGKHILHFVKVKAVTDPVPEPAAGGDAEGNILCFWAVANDIDDIYGLITGTKKFLALTIWKDPDDIINGGAPCFQLYEGHAGGSTGTYSPELTEGKTYSFEILRNVDKIIVKIYEDDVYWWTLNLTMTEGTNTFRYLYGCSTSNTSTASHCDVDIDNLEIETETELVSVTGNIFKDIINSWTPQTMTNLRIRITSAVANKAWAISQLYIYKAEEIDYRIMCEEELVADTGDKITNGGFESGNSGWVLEGMGAEISSDAHTGSFGCNLYSDWFSRSRAIQAFIYPILGSTVTELSFWIKNVSGWYPYLTDVFRVYIHYTDGTETIISYDYLDICGHSYPWNEWNKQTITSIETSKYIDRITFENNMVGYVNTVIDDVVLIGTTMVPIGEIAFPLEQYIQAVSFDDEYTSPIGPLNVPKARLLDAINSIVELCNSAYVSFDCWLAFDSLNTFHMATVKGSDKSATISFIKGTHLGGVKRSGTVAESVQRLQIVGKGEGKKQDDVSSDWITDVAALADVNTFYEDIQTEKSIANKDIANFLANIRVKDNSLPTLSIEVNVTNDVYSAGVYVVGDYVTVTDSLTGTSGAQRIYNIRKSVDGDMGETIRLNVNAPRVIVEDEIKEIYRRLKELGIVGTLAIDWGGEALNETKVSAEMALSSLFEKTAKNDTIDAKKDVQDPSWFIDPDPTTYTPQSGHIGLAGGPPTAENYEFDYGVKWHHSDDWMKITGPTSDSSLHTLLIEIRGHDAEGNVISLPLSQNPKLTVELKLVKDSTATPSPLDWYEGDYFAIGLYDSVTSKGYSIVFVKESGVLNAYAAWNETGNPADIKRKLLRNVEISDVGLQEDKRYKIEIITEKENNLVIFNLYDISSLVEEKYPPSVIATNITLTNTVKPLFMFMSANNNGNTANLCQVYIYNFKTEIEKVQR